MKLQDNFAVFDFETTPIETSKIKDSDGNIKFTNISQKFLIGGIYYDGIFSYSENIKEMTNLLLQCNKSRIYAHNITYDFRFLLNELKERKIIQDVLLCQSDIIKIKLNKGTLQLPELRDTYCIFRDSLHNIGNNICHINKKKEMNLDKVVYLIRKYNPNYILDSNSKAVMLIEEMIKYPETKELVIEYLKYDCLTLFEAIQIFKDFLKTENLKLTIASQSMSEFNKLNRMKEGGFKYSYNLPKYFKNDNLDKLFRFTYYGGRTEVFKNYGDNLYYYDFNSLYPSVMAKYDFPYGDIKLLPNSENPDDYDFYIAEVSFNIPKTYITNIPFRANKKLYFPYGKFYKRWYNSIEIKQLQKEGVKVFFHKVYAWDNSSFIFSDFINKFYSIRLKAKQEGNKSYDKLSKYIMNSLYGKFAQSEEFDTICFLDKEDVYNKIIELDKENKRLTDMEGIENTYYITSTKEKKFTSSYLSSFITSYARRELYNLLNYILEQEGEFYYCDTDSVFTNLDLSNLCSSDLGKLKMETNKNGCPLIKRAVFVLPKLYALQYDDGSEIVKVKGFFTHNHSFDDIENILCGGKIHEEFDTISKIRKIAKEYLLSTECYHVSKDVSFDKQMLKREFNGNSSMPFDTYNLYDISNSTNKI